MRIVMTRHAGEHEQFAPGAFDSQVGKPIPVSVQGALMGRGTVVAVKVADDRLSVDLTVDLPG